MHRQVTVLLLATLLASLAVAVLQPAAVGAQACTELVTNGGFETTAGWALGVSPVSPQYVTFTAHSGARSLQLGITGGANVETFSSARQTVSVPGGTGPVTLSLWYYAMAEAPATTDYMELALLSADGSVILAKPWQSHDDSRIWNQMAFDLSAWRGQTFQIYFNVYNDGKGGQAALFLDDISLTSCPTAGTPGPTSTVTGTITPSAVPPTPTRTATPGCTDLLRNGDFSAGLGDWDTLGDPSGVTLATDRYRSAPYSLKLGSLDVNLNGLASARQLINIPAGSPTVNLEVWVFNQSQPGAGADYQEIALLNSMGGLLYVPYRGPSNESAWVRLTFNLAAFAGQTVYLRFAVNNDGTGGRTVMYVDDVRLTACSSGYSPTSTPTAPPVPTATRTWTPVPTYNPPPATFYPPPATYAPPPATGCVELTQNGGFEAGLAGWAPGNAVLRPAVVTSPVLAGAYAAQLGTVSENKSSYSSIRQTVNVPWGYARTVVSFWTYTWADMAGGGGDKQEFVLLGPGNVVWATPWKVLENSQTWQQHVFDLVGAGGQTFDLYFAAINDGVGGRTALFLDEVHLWGCSGGAYPFSGVQPPVAQPQQAAPMAAQPVPVPQVYPVETLPAAGAMGAGLLAVETPAAMAETPGLPAAQWTQIAIGQQPGAVLVVTATPLPTVIAVVVTATPDAAGRLAGLPPEPGAIAQLGTAVAGTPIVTADLAPQPARFLSNITDRWPRGWQYGILALVLIVLVAFLISRARRP